MCQCCFFAFYISIITARYVENVKNIFCFCKISPRAAARLDGPAPARYTEREKTDGEAFSMIWIALAVRDVTGWLAGAVSQCTAGNSRSNIEVGAMTGVLDDKVHG